MIMLRILDVAKPSLRRKLNSQNAHILAVCRHRQVTIRQSWDSLETFIRSTHDFVCLQAGLLSISLSVFCPRQKMPYIKCRTTGVKTGITNNKFYIRQHYNFISSSSLPSSSAAESSPITSSLIIHLHFFPFNHRLHYQTHGLHLFKRWQCNSTTT